MRNRTSSVPSTALRQPTMFYPLSNVVGPIDNFEWFSKRLISALYPYRDYEETREEIERLKD